MLGSEVCSRSTVREEDPLDRIRFELKPEGRESMRSVQVRKNALQAECKERGQLGKYQKVTVSGGEDSKEKREGEEVEKRGFSD